MTAIGKWNPDQRIRMARRNSFTIFVDRIFTNSIEPLFTNIFDAFAPIAAIACLYRAGNAG